VVREKVLQVIKLRGGLMKIMFSVLGLGIITTACLLEGAHLKNYVQGPAFMIVVGGTFFLTLGHHSVAHVRAAFQAVLVGDTLSVEEATRHILVFSTARMIAQALGAIGFLLGLVHVLGHLSDPTKIGAGLAVSLISTLYGLILAELILGPLKNRVSSSVADVNATALKAASPSGMIWAISVFGALFLLMLTLYVVGK
jgi:flagellar motor component MotA